MIAIDVADFNVLMDNKIKSFETDVALYRSQDQLAAEVAQYSIDLLKSLKAEVNNRSYEVVIDRYKKSGQDDSVKNWKRENRERGTEKKVEN